MPRSTALNDRLQQATQAAIVQAATDAVVEQGLAKLTNAEVAARAGMAERTVYRYYATRELLVKDIAAEVGRRLSAPQVPLKLADLHDFVKRLYGAFEQQPALTREALSSDLYIHIRDNQALERWQQLRQLLAAHWPALPAERRELAVINLRFLLTATSWNYHRAHLCLSAKMTLDVVLNGVDAILAALGPPKPAK
jgi:AcrR family transcriptional regulator